MVRTSLHEDLLATSLHTLFKTMRRPQVWTVTVKQAGVDIDRPAFSLLAVLAHAESGSCRVNDIAEALGVEAPSVSRKVQQLEREGLVVRVPDDKDGRAVRLRATAEGKAIYKRVKDAQLAIYRQAFAGWSEADKQQIATPSGAHEQRLASHHDIVIT